MPGMGSHQSAASKSNVWFTPPAIIEALGGPASFDLDPATDTGRPWDTALHHYTPEDDGLACEWFGRVWLNPPYSNPVLGQFLNRMAAHDHGILLTFARTDTEAFFSYVFHRATGLLFLPGRLHFHHPDGRRAKFNGGAPSVLAAYGPEDRDILAAAPIEGHFVPLALPVSVMGALLDQTWIEAVQATLARSNAPMSLSELYRAFINHPKARANQHWREKLRQTLARGDFERVAKGVWTNAETLPPQ